MSRFQEWIAYIMIVGVVIVTLWQSGVRQLMFLLRSVSWRGVRIFLSHREWYVVFALANLLVFWFSMNTVENKSLVETLAGNFYVTGQIGVQLFAANLVTHWRWTRGRRAVYDFTDKSRVWPWLTSCYLAMIVNGTACYDSVAKLLEGTVGNRKFTIWILMDVFAILFYLPIAVMLHRAKHDKRMYDVLRSPKIAWLWAVVLILVILTYLDLTTGPK